MHFAPIGLITAALLLAACNQAPAPSDASRPQPPQSKGTLVETATVAREPVVRHATRTGTLKARRTVVVANQEEGRLVALPFFEGDRVEKGQVLFRLDGTQLEAELRKAGAQRRQAELDLERLQRLQKNKLVAEEETARAATAVDVARAEEDLLRIRLGYTTEQARFTGLVSERRADVGGVIPRFTHLLTLIDPTSLVVEVEVSELLLPLIAVGDTVEVRCDALGGEPHPGRILRIHPSVQAATRQGMVEAELTPAPAGLMPGQLCRVRLESRAAPRLTVPFEALRNDMQGEYVFQVVDGKAKRTPVVSGAQLGPRVEIIDGIGEGSAVVVRGFLDLSDGDKVRLPVATR